MNNNFKMLLFILLMIFKIVDATERPIIGILAQEIETDDPYKSQNYTSFLPAAYVKAVEASGARVVPVFIRRDANYYKDLALKLNGFLFTGGSSDLFSHDGVARSGKIILDEVLKLNDDGINIPILGVCQGFELLAVLSSDWRDVLAYCGIDNEALSIKFLPSYRNGSLYKGISEDDVETLSHLPSTSNHHDYCLTQKNLTLFNLTQWKVLSTSSFNNMTFVSSMEWENKPIAGVQFHPEKLAYEWAPDQMNPHDAKSIRANRLFYDWLTAESKLNNNTYSNDTEEMDDLIYNYNAIYTGITGGYDEQVYYFKDPSGNLETNISVVNIS